MRNGKTTMFRKIFDSLQWTQLSPVWVVPTILFLVCFFSFGILLSGLGYFQDDWHHVYYAYHEGAQGLKSFFFTDSRPFAYFIYNVLFSVLGFDPAHWHWTLMFLRFLTALSMWLLLRQIWPDKEDLTAWLTLFFALHPVFTLQPLSVAYILHWVSYLSLALSFTLMVFAIRQQKWFWLLSITALLLQIFHLLMMEYYAGLEIFRIFLIWLMLNQLSGFKRIKKSLLVWLPYFFILALYAIYRLSYNKLFGYDRFEPVFLIGLITSPISTLMTLFQILIQDSIFILVSPWYTAVDPSVFELTRWSTWGMVAGAMFFAGIFYFGISRLKQTLSQESAHSEATPLIIYGFLSLVFGMFPAWAVGFSIFAKNPLWSSRFALPALLGASFFSVGLVYFFSQNSDRRNILLSILLGISVAFHVQTARDFNQSWEKQLQFYWQLYWRAPSLEPGTLLVADSEILPYMGDSPTAYAINLLYPKTYSPPQTDYWFSPGSKEVPDSFLQGQPAQILKYSSVFSAEPEKVVAITFEPAQGQCLWFLRPTYQEIRFLSVEAYRWMQISDISLAKPDTSAAPPAAIFGDEPKHTWCYYYQKADLAAQRQDWINVITLWKEANTKNHRPSNSVELLPFIEAYAHSSDWKQAQKLTFQADTLPPRMPSLLCTLWQSFEQANSDEPAQKIISETREKLKCQQ